MKIPPFLPGTVLLFWGWQTGMLLPAFVMAFLLEGTRFLPWKWSFSYQDFNHILDLCVILFVLVAAQTYLSHEFTHATLLLCQRLPMLIFPLILSQACSMEGHVRISRFFLLFREELRGTERPYVSISFIYPYLALCLLSASAANGRTLWFYPGLCLFAGWSLWFIRPRRFSLPVWVGLLLSVGLVGYAGQIGLHHFQDVLEIKFLEWFSDYSKDTDPYRSYTAIGDVGTLKQSDRILFRVRLEGKDVHPPLLLRNAAYNLFGPSSWLAWSGDFYSVKAESNGTTWKLRSGLPSENSITVSTYLKGGKALLVLPNNALQVENLPVLKMVQNRFGAVKVEDGPGLITYRMRPAQQDQLDLGVSDTPDETDFEITPKEVPAISKIAGELNLNSLGPREVLTAVGAFFQKKFRYSLYQPMEQYDRHMNRTPLGHFLLHSRSGHCEYFATATVLLLRRVGIPARYATGYLVQEFSALENVFLVRSRHAHAWALFYMDGAWHDFDTTPASWVDVEAQAAPSWKSVYDFFSACLFFIYAWWWSEGEGEFSLSAGWFLIPVFLFIVWKFFPKKLSIRRERKRQQERMQIAPLGSDSEFYLIVEKMSHMGLSRHPWEPLSDWMGRIESDLSFPVSPHDLRSILDLHYRYRYDPEGINEEERIKLRTSVHSWLEQLERASESNPDKRHLPDRNLP